MNNSQDELHYLLKWLSVLSNGYVKPDVNKGHEASNNTTGVIRDTKDFRPYINAINKKLSETLNIDIDE